MVKSADGIRQWVAEGIRAAIGTDMSSFPSAKHLASWTTGVQAITRAGKPLRRTTRKGSPSLRQRLRAVAWAAARTNIDLCDQYRRIAKRRGLKKALFAVAHAILVICFHL